MSKNSKSKGRKRGPKPKGGVYANFAVRVKDREELDAIAELSPESRGELLVKGVAASDGILVAS